MLDVKGLKELKAYEGVMCYWQNICNLLKVFGVFEKKALKANLGVRCYLHIFLLKVLDDI